VKGTGQRNSARKGSRDIVLFLTQEHTALSAHIFFCLPILDEHINRIFQKGSANHTVKFNIQDAALKIIWLVLHAISNGWI